MRIKIQKILTVLALSFFMVPAKNCMAKNNVRDSIIVYVFLSESCPICRNQTLSLRELYKSYQHHSIGFVGVFPNLEHSTQETIEKFGKKYHLKFPLIRDENHILTKRFSAVVTPQVFVVQQSTGNILYCGKVDNSFESIGKRRSVITEFYLRDALDALIRNKDVLLSVTQPVGCYIVK